MFKLGSRLLITGALLALVVALATSGNAFAAQRAAANVDPATTTTGGIQPLGTPDSGEPDITQTGRNAPGGSGEMQDGGVLSALPEVPMGGVVRWVMVIWTLRYLGLGT